jgi:RNA-directed DNA polymerase
VIWGNLSKFFDRVHHQRLLDRMAQQVSDRRLLALVRRMLTAGVVMPDGTKIAVTEGTPQGGPLSPLLSNIVLDELDWELERRGHRFVRYADDSNIFVRSARAGERVMASIRHFLERRMRLKVNEEKSGIRQPHEVHFLGFRFQCRQTAEGWQTAVLLSAKAERRLRTTVRVRARFFDHAGSPKRLGGNRTRVSTALVAVVAGAQGRYWAIKYQSEIKSAIVPRGLHVPFRGHTA